MTIENFCDETRQAIQNETTHRMQAEIDRLREENERLLTTLHHYEARAAADHKTIADLREQNLQLMEANPLYGICLRLGRAYVRLKAQGHVDSMGEVGLKEMKEILPEAFSATGVFRDWNPNEADEITRLREENAHLSTMLGEAQEESRQNGIAALKAQELLTELSTAVQKYDECGIKWGEVMKMLKRIQEAKP